MSLSYQTNSGCADETISVTRHSQPVVSVTTR